MQCPIITIMSTRTANTLALGCTNAVEAIVMQPFDISLPDSLGIEEPSYGYVDEHGCIDESA